MNDDRYRRLARIGLAPLVEDLPDPPEWEEFTVVTVGAARRRRLVPAWIVALATAVAAVAVVGGPAIVFNLTRPATPVQDMPFDVQRSVATGKRWWSAVISADRDEAVALAHPEATFNYEALSETLAGLGEPVAISMELEEFGTNHLPQLCFTVEGRDGELVGSLVFRQYDQEWLPWELRSGTEFCGGGPSPTTTLTAPTAESTYGTKPTALALA